jgi:putative two-component system response regulator
MLLQNKRIFMIDDQSTYITITSIFLRSAGAVVEAERGSYNIPEILMQHWPIDLILLDLVLGKNVSGFEIFEQIRKVPALATIPVVLVSAADPEIAVPLAKQMGFSGFISKPISPCIIRDVASVLNGNKVWQTEGWDYWATRLRATTAAAIAANIY